MSRVTRRRAARLAIMGALLDAERPHGILETVRHLMRLQMDPTAVVARTEHLELFSRLGPYDRGDLDRLMWNDRKLFEYWAFIVPMADLPLYRPTMRRVLIRDTSRSKHLRRWLADNAAFRRRVLREIARRGPLRSRDIDDAASVGYTSGGWNDGRNVTRMLDVLWAKGELAIVGRDGNERIWGLARDWYPSHEARVSDRDVAREAVRRGLRAQGIARASALGYVFGGRAPGSDRALADLVREGEVVPVEIDGVRGQHYAPAELLDRPFRGRTAILSPFDKLVHDRVRARELFDLDYRLEIYVPPSERRWGYYVLPVLRGDRFVARFDARAFRATGEFRVFSVHAEPGANEDDARAVGREIRRLARWSGAPDVVYGKVPRGWRSALA